MNETVSETRHRRAQNAGSNPVRLTNKDVGIFVSYVEMTPGLREAIEDTFNRSVEAAE